MQVERLFKEKIFISKEFTKKELQQELHEVEREVRDVK